MDPTTLIIQALVSGAAASAQATASDAVRDAYTGLKTMIERRFVGRPAAEMALVEHAKQPEAWEAPLKASLGETDADKDPVVVQAAQHLIALTLPPDAAAGKFRLEFDGTVHGVAVGDGQHVTMDFSGPATSS